jgi:predicted PurR-regulated permease PerM
VAATGIDAGHDRVRSARRALTMGLPRAPQEVAVVADRSTSDAAGPAPEPGSDDEHHASAAELLRGAPRFFFAVASAAIVVAALHYGEPVLMPFAFAALLAFVLDPLVSRLRHWGVPLAFAVALVVSATLGALGAAAAVGMQQLVALSEGLPRYQSTIQNKLRSLGAGGGNSAVSSASRVIAAVENEIDAARTALEPRSGAAARATTRVQVEPVPASPLRALGQMLSPLMYPLATTGLIIVLLAYMLAQRREISDRAVRLIGGDMHRMADALNDAARRVSRYLAATLLVNSSYGAALAVGLYAIGVPSPWLIGAVATVLRFVPYLGPLVAAVLPLALALAVDPGWDMLVWTGALILVLELIFNNLVEPVAYGGSTGVSPVAVLLSAAFWVVIWGPVGLVLATPITVCLVVLGRHLGPLKFLDLLLGAGPAFDRPTVLYQRLISGDLEEAIQLAGDEVERTSLRDFYGATGVPMLALACAAAQHRASTQQRHRVVSGASRILDELRAELPVEEAPSGTPRVLCIGARTEWDTLSAEMLAHLLSREGTAAQAVPAVSVSAERIGEIALDGVAAVVLCTFNSAPQTLTRFVGRRLRRRFPNLQIVLAAWSLPAEQLEPGSLELLGVDAAALTVNEAAGRVAALLAQGDSDAPPAPAPDVVEPVAGEDAVAPWRELLARTAQRAAEVFHVPLASVWWQAPDGQGAYECAGQATSTRQHDADVLASGTPLRAVLDSGAALRLEDIARDPDYADAVDAGFEGLVAFAGVPMLDRARKTIGVLAIHDSSARAFTDEELALLESMAAELGRDLHATAAQADVAQDAPGEGVRRLVMR